MIPSYPRGRFPPVPTEAGLATSARGARRRSPQRPADFNRPTGDQHAPRPQVGTRGLAIPSRRDDALPLYPGCLVLIPWRP
jgi:hypothetical protein